MAAGYTKSLNQWKNTGYTIEYLILLLIVIISFMIRTFAVIRFESLIHEYDPNFNYRVTEYLANTNFHEFWNWFDDSVWYPLGRSVGRTLYPGLMLTSYAIYYIFNHVLGLLIDIKCICVFIGPIFSSFTCIITYLLVRELFYDYNNDKKRADFNFICSSFGHLDGEQSEFWKKTSSDNNSSDSIKNNKFDCPKKSSSSHYKDVDSANNVKVNPKLFKNNYEKLERSNSNLVGSSKRKYDKIETDEKNKIRNQLPPISGNSAGLLAALIIGINPAYLSRSIAGSFDNEAIAIFAMILSFYSFMRAINKPTIMNSMFAGLTLNYMAMSWGGYVFPLNLISVFVVATVLLDKFKIRHYIVYSIFYIFITLYTFNIPVINNAAFNSAESMPSHGCFIVVNAIMLARYVKPYLSKGSYRFCIRLLIFVPIITFLITFIILLIQNRTYFTGRSMTLLDPSYASKNVPIIASVSEHQPTTWFSYFFDLHMCSIFGPIGLFISFFYARDAFLLIGLYGLLGIHFSSIMIRLMLILAPAAAILSGISISYILTFAMNGLKKEKKEKNDKNGMISGKLPTTIAISVIALISLIVRSYIVHSTWISSVAYSHPSIVQSLTLKNGKRMIQDDFREAYYWLRQNTDQSSKLMSWWDYGYQASALAGRTTMVDNNTWNDTHIATVGLAFTSSEEKAYKILLDLDVDYVFVVFGGLSRYQSDDINKLIWIIRISSGVYPQIQQTHFLSKDGQYILDSRISPALKNCLMFKLSYHGVYKASQGYDFVRNYKVDANSVELKYLEEAYTTRNWIVRIYKVKKPQNLSSV